MTHELFIVAVDLGGHTAPVLVAYSGLGGQPAPRDPQILSADPAAEAPEPAAC